MQEGAEGCPATDHSGAALLCILLHPRPAAASLLLQGLCFSGMRSGSHKPSCRSWLAAAALELAGSRRVPPLVIVASHSSASSCAQDQLHGRLLQGLCCWLDALWVPQTQLLQLTCSQICR